MDINTRDMAFVNCDEEEMQWVKVDGVTVYEAWKELIASGVPPLTLLNCKGVDLVNYKLYGNSVQDGTPTPDTPIEVESVGERTKNLVDIKDLVVGGVTQSINVEISKTFTVSVGEVPIEIDGNHWRIRFQLKDGTYLYNATDDNLKKGQVTINVDENNPVVNMYARTDRIISGKYSNIQLEEGTKATDYEPYGYKIPVKASGKNKLNPSIWENETTEYGLAIKYDKEEDCFVINGTATSTRSYNLKYINVPANVGGRYSFTVDYVSGKITRPNGTNYAMVYFGKNDNINTNSNWSAVSMYEYTNTRENTICDNRYISAMWFYIASGVSFDNYKIRIQIEEGSNVTDYEPYKEPITTNIYLDKPLRKIGNYSDYIDFENKKVSRVVKEIICDGTEDWKLLNPGMNVAYYYLDIGDYGYVVAHNGLNTHFERKTISTSNTDVGYNPTNSSSFKKARILVRPKKDMTGYTNAVEWIAFLKEQYNNGTPMKIYYVLTTPEIKENVELPNIPTLKGTTILSVDTNIQPSNLEVVYKGKKVKTDSA